MKEKKTTKSRKLTTFVSFNIDNSKISLTDLQTLLMKHPLTILMIDE